MLLGHTGECSPVLTFWLRRAQEAAAAAVPILWTGTQETPHNGSLLALPQAFEVEGSQSGLVCGHNPGGHKFSQGPGPLMSLHHHSCGSPRALKRDSGCLVLVSPSLLVKYLSHVLRARLIVPMRLVQGGLKHSRGCSVAL